MYLICAFHKGQTKTVGWKMCFVNEQSQWHQPFQGISGLRGLQNSGLLSSEQTHVSLSYLSLFLGDGQTSPKGKDELVFVSLVPCSEINSVPCGKELDGGPPLPSFRLFSNLCLYCFGVWW